jgi:hypothetical protein
MERGRKLISRSFEVFESEITGIIRKASSRSKVSPLFCREGWELSSSLLNTSVVDIAFVYDEAYDQDELFLVDFEELLYPVIVYDTGRQNGCFDVGII